MGIGFDSAKSERNLLARGISFELAAEFEWDGALIVHMMVFTPRGNRAHVISLRKASKREVKRYEAQA